MSLHHKKIKFSFENILQFDISKEIVYIDKTCFKLAIGINIAFDTLKETNIMSETHIEIRAIDSRLIFGTDMSKMKPPKIKDNFALNVDVNKNLLCEWAKLFQWVSTQCYVFNAEIIRINNKQAVKIVCPFLFTYQLKSIATYVHVDNVHLFADNNMINITIIVTDALL